MRPISKMFNRAAATCAVIGALACGSPVQANTLDTTGWLHGSIAETVHQGPLTENVAAGGFTGVWHSGTTPDVLTPITFWCFELTQYFNPGTSYPGYTAAPLAGPVATQIAQLFEEAFALAGTSTIYSTAFQLAIWDIEYDSNRNVNLGPGFYATGGSTDGGLARDRANIWLAHLGDYTGAGWAITRLSNSYHQDFIVGNMPPAACCKRELPEPPMLPLLLTAMGMAALLESRRRLRSRGV
jgi:hypothetical protein